MPLTRSPMRDAIAMSMMAGTPQDQDQLSRPPVFGGPPVSLAQPQGRPPVFSGGRSPATVGSSRPAVFTGGGPVTPTPQPLAAAAGTGAGAMAAQGANMGFRYGRTAQPAATPADPFAQQNEPFLQYGFGGMY